MSVILFVDHELTIHEFLPYAAQRAGHIVYRADSIAAALEHFSRYRPDLIVISDRLPGDEMPDKGGFELARRAGLLGFEGGDIIMLSDVVVKDMMSLKDMLRGAGLDGVHFCQIRAGYLPFLRTMQNILGVSPDAAQPLSCLDPFTRSDPLQNRKSPWT